MSATLSPAADAVATLSCEPAAWLAYRLKRRSGDVVAFEPAKITVAMGKAFVAVKGAGVVTAASTRDDLEALTDTVLRALQRLKPTGGSLLIEDVQDQVELALMRSGHHDVARAYVLYREARAQERATLATLEAARTGASAAATTLRVRRPDGSLVPLDLAALAQRVAAACGGLGADVQPAPVMQEAERTLYDGVAEAEVDKALLLAARTRIELDPGYSQVSARLLLDSVAREVWGETVPAHDRQSAYTTHFAALIERGIAADLLNAELRGFDLPRLAAVLRAERDEQFDYLGLQTLYDRYFLHIAKRRIEMPQQFFMRVAMGLALREDDRNARAIEFYELLSSFDFMSSTPTLFNSGTPRSQLSSCYLTSVPDDLGGIYGAIRDNALLSKFAGGLGNDWSRVRALGAHIHGTNGESQGVVPFLKVVNDTAVAVNQGGKRKGAVCAYLETWHLDIEEFLELRKNTGDDRRRTHDMNTANWIPDLFMRRVLAKAEWTLFSPSDVPELHDLYGNAFNAAYEAAEARTQTGEIAHFKRIPAQDLWRKMLSMLFETGHPWITFKDPCNLRSPQPHVGVVHSSNLCTEITLNTSDDEIAVCNLGSINLARHLVLVESAQGDSQAADAGAFLTLDLAKLQRTARTAMRMLDNVIDINYYAVPQAAASNARHRPVGLGIMGFQDCLYQLRLPYASAGAVEFADRSMEAVCYFAYAASSELAAERGRYESYEGSLWSMGQLPLDTLGRLADTRLPGELDVDRSQTLDWDALRAQIARHGMRNSNCVAIAPTATISNIVGVDASIEPCFGNLSVKSNLSGEFTVINQHLVRELKGLGLWDAVMVMDLKHYDGQLGAIARVPDWLKQLYATAFEVGPEWLVEAASRRQKWIDQAQSLNLYLQGASGKQLDAVYKLAWVRGLKTTYYLRTTSATQAEKSTVNRSSLNAVQSGATPASAGLSAAEQAILASALPASDVKFCAIDNPDCEACQ
ncbi:ribonucleoside-diphosphate reductase subunit alpha [Comamonas serinivorans]|uniref:Ribonucleoside-diphosphate reductase n=1 Tax=Comamonas serinivorans TaxID=1082851 RepID=A0A1Y0ENV7_9BURK|nr:ribonucleoside-diphosphate reductase subunit alpha [Comamonas serinivorans]ARU05138.1 ribonucleoside-diphosphate reductase subunit alpha [Comamonas serinivorans]